MKTEKSVLDYTAAEMSDATDFEIMASLLLDAGWTEVTICRRPRFELAEISQWCNARGCMHRAMGKRWLFKEAKDAMWFTLRWSS